MKKETLEKVLMVIGFIVGGIGTARMMSDLPDDTIALKKRLTESDSGTSDQATE